MGDLCDRWPYPCDSVPLPFSAPINLVIFLLWLVGCYQLVNAPRESRLSGPWMTLFRIGPIVQLGACLFR